MTGMPVDRFDWERVLQRVDVPRVAQAVGMMMASKADPDGSRIFPGIAWLEAHMAYEERQIRRGIQWLVEHELLECVYHGNRHIGQSKMYRLTCNPEILNLTSTLRPDERIVAHKPVDNSVDNSKPDGTEQAMPQGLSDISVRSIGHSRRVYRTSVSAHQTQYQTQPEPDRLSKKGHHARGGIVDGQLPLVAVVDSKRRPSAWRRIAKRLSA